MTDPRSYGLTWDQAEFGAGTWQGIRALTFSDPTPVGLAAELQLVLERPADDLAAADILVTGPDGPLSDVAVTVADGDLFALLQFLPVAGGMLPRGPHEVTLLSAGNDSLHPFFTRSGFDFYIDCPAGDCRPETPGGQRAYPAEPAIDLKTKDYTGFMQVARDWVRSSGSVWSDTSAASTEGTLLELLAHHGEMLSLYQDRVAQEAFIDTARERVSLTRHAAMLGLDLDQGASAQTVVAFDIASIEAGYLPAGTPVLRKEDSGQVTIQFETTETALLDPRWNGGFSDPADVGILRPAAWPNAADALLPVGSKQILLLDWNLGLGAGQQLAFVQGTRTHLARLTGVQELEKPGWTESPSDPVTTDLSQATLVTWDAPTALAFQPWSDPENLPFLICANLVTASQGETRRAGNTGAPGEVGLSAGRQDAIFATDPATGLVLLRGFRTPEPDVLNQMENAVPRPATELMIDGQEFSWQPNLRQSAGFDTHYSTEREDDGSIWILLGDGVRGKAVPAGKGFSLPDTPLALTYRRGVATKGNLGAFALNAVGRFDTQDQLNAEINDLDIRFSTNIIRASGGRLPVSLDTARQLIPESIRHPDRERCVTTEDYRLAAEEIPGVAQAAARPLGGLFNTLAVLIAPEQGSEPSPELLDQVFSHLDGLRMAGREHIIRAPDYLPLDIALLICPANGANSATVRKQVRLALTPQTAGQNGFFSRANIGFGQEVRLSDVLAAVQNQPAVGAVRALTFRPLFEGDSLTIRRAIRPGPTQIAQFEGDESRPDNGRLTIRIEGIDPPEPPPAAFVVSGPAPEPASGGMS